jgi:hypothetical protein
MLIHNASKMKSELERMSYNTDNPLIMIFGQEEFKAAMRRRKISHD